LVFLETSLRTRLGFSAATARLGGWPLAVFEQRFSEISMHESIHDTIRALSGYCDALVVRLPQALDSTVVPVDTSCPILNGGDRGSAGEHPSQALIDLFAIRSEFQQTAGLKVVVVGSPHMRSVRSLCRLLAEQEVASIRILTTDHLWEQDGFSLPAADRIMGWEEASDADLVYIAGIPHRAVPLADRDFLRLTTERLGALRPDCVVTSPLPVVDEISSNAWRDPRVRAFRHSDHGLFVRMAILELVLLER